MFYLPLALGVWLHVFFWGAGLAMLAMPRPWRRWWPVLAWPAGFTLQSVIVWLGAYANVQGTDRYAWWSEVVPAILLAIGWRRHGFRAGRELGKFRGLMALMAVNLAALVLPLAIATRGLTTVSLGSLDAADYAAGARVLKEFAHADRMGFLGQTEVVHVASTDNFFDFWLRLNHFTPSALIAFNGTIFDCSPVELTSVLTAVFLVGSLPVVFWLARALLGYRVRVAVWVTAIYGFSPITWYAVFHVAMGQLLAAPAIGLATWGGVALWRGRLSWRRAAEFAGLLAVAYGLILGAYNFILLVGLVPVLAYAGGTAVWRREWRRFAGWMLAMLAPLVLAGLIFWERVAGLLERFQLFRIYNFGWRVPLLTPEGWLGLVRDHELRPWHGGARLAIGVALGLVVVVCARQVQDWRKRKGYLMACLTIPALCGYGFLYARGVLRGTNASYDAYKIFAVFYPGMLPVFGAWAAWGLRGGGRVRGLTIAAMTLVLGANLERAWRVAEHVQVAPFSVPRELIRLQLLENAGDIGSLNMLLPDGWVRLWANALLLRTPQYFRTHTYEGRLNTALKGKWDLTGGFIDIRLPKGGSRKVSEHFTLVNPHSPYAIRARFADGWYEPEQLPEVQRRWVWTKESAKLQIENLQSRPLRVRLGFNIRSVENRNLELSLNGKQEAVLPVSVKEEKLAGPVITLGPGESTLDLRTGGPVSPLASDSRILGFCIFRIMLEVLPDPAEEGK